MSKKIKRMQKKIIASGEGRTRDLKIMRLTL